MTVGQAHLRDTNQLSSSERHQTYRALLGDICLNDCRAHLGDISLLGRVTGDTSYFAILC